jgi:hypothetical protein
VDVKDELSAQTTQVIAPPKVLCRNSLRPLQGAVALQTTADATIGIAADLEKLHRVAGALKGTGGALAVIAVGHGVATGDWWEAGWGAADIGVLALLVVAPETVPLASEYFTARTAMGVTEMAGFALRSSSERRRWGVKWTRTFSWASRALEVCSGSWSRLWCRLPIGTDCWWKNSIALRIASG